MSTSTSTGPYLDDEIRHRIERCPKLASLQSINRKLAGLVNSEQSYTSQIAEIIRRDPSLTARLLRMVNSVYFGLSAKVNNIEEAVLYLGLRQIRELSMATPVIEDMERISSSSMKLPWRELWQHSIGTAIMTREILATTNLLVDDDTDYIIGLLHNVGKVVLGTAWQSEFEKVIGADHADAEAVCAAERALVGWDHAAIGGYYLERHQLAPEIVESVRHHAHPGEAGDYRMYAAAVQVADLVVREVGIPSGFERVPSLEAGAWRKAEGWHILFNANEREESLAQASIENIMAKLPGMLSGMV
ncbi:MAG: HDOD domain-containing protein [Opitutaceae bacterium]|jgi:HD-like signal output (HDOD) protein